MSSEPLLHDLYTLFFSYTQSSIYRTFLRTLSSSLPSLYARSSSSSSSSSWLRDSRLSSDFVLYSRSQSALSQSDLVTISFALFVAFLLAFPACALLSVSLGFHSSLFVYLAVLSTVYVAMSTVVYSLVLLESLTKGAQSFPLTLSSLVYLYLLNVASFALAYYTMLRTYGDGKEERVLEGLRASDGLENLVHCLYFSISVFTTVGFGDVSARWWLCRLLVSAELALSSLLHILVFGKGIDLIIARQATLSRQVGAPSFDAESSASKRQ